MIGPVKSFGGKLLISDHEIFNVQSLHLFLLPC